MDEFEIKLLALRKTAETLLEEYRASKKVPASKKLARKADQINRVEAARARIVGKARPAPNR